MKSYVARHGVEEYFKLWQVMGKNPEKYGEMGAIDSAKEAMKEIGHSENEFERTMDTTSATLELRGKMNMNAYRNFLKETEESMLKSLSNHDIRVLLTVPHNASNKMMTRKIDNIREKLILENRFSQQKINSFINTLNSIIPRK